jgi:hypothetical protein
MGQLMLGELMLQEQASGPSRNEFTQNSDCGQLLIRENNFSNTKLDDNDLKALDQFLAISESEVSETRPSAIMTTDDGLHLTTDEDLRLQGEYFPTLASGKFN